MQNLDRLLSAPSLMLITALALVPPLLAWNADTRVKVRPNWIEPISDKPGHTTFTISREVLNEFSDYR